jgi:subfamily B ATP-binding cassette protein HlyB/CyaB
MAVIESITRQGFVWGLTVICQLKGIPLNAELLLRRFPPPYDLTALQQAAMELGLKVSLQSVHLSDIHPSSLPVLVVMEAAEATSAHLDPKPTEDSETAGDNAEAGLALILRADGERVLCLLQNTAIPQTLPLSQFEKEMTGQVIFFTPQHEQVNEQGEVTQAKNNKQPLSGRFGFRWFIPELLKHKKIWREILVASFAIQLVALATPLCTQIIIDKVVVHHTTSTLVVIATALAIFLIFNAAMGWVRQYLVLHTGNRMDAVLGHHVFSHLLHLPMGYFDH